MKTIALICILLVSSSSFAQSMKFKIDATRIYLPTSLASREYYHWNNSGKQYHDYYKRQDFARYRFKNYQRTPMKKGRVDRKCNASDAFDYTKAHLNDSIFYLGFDSFYPDSVDMNFLKANGYVKGDSLRYDVRKFHEGYFLPRTIIIGADTLSMPRFDGIQIDGEWLHVHLIEENDTLISYYQGASMPANAEEINSWLLLQKMYAKFGLFQNLGVEHYFGKKDVTNEIERYIKALKKVEEF